MKGLSFNEVGYSYLLKGRLLGTAAKFAANPWGRPHGTGCHSSGPPCPQYKVQSRFFRDDASESIKPSMELAQGSVSQHFNALWARGALLPDR